MYLRQSAAAGQQQHTTNAGLPTWEVLRPDEVSSLGAIGAGAGMKRGHESVEDFFTDMKKRRVAPSYDPRGSISHFISMASSDLSSARVAFRHGRTTL